MTVTVDKLNSQSVRANTNVDFETLFQEHWPHIYGVIYRIVGDRAEAEDLALETFLKLHGQINGEVGVKGLSTTSGWLYRVATNLGLNALRSRKRREQYELEGGKSHWRPPIPKIQLWRSSGRRNVKGCT